MEKTTTILCILDGVGENPNTHGNAVAAAHTPTFDRFYKTHPHSQILTHGKAVGLPEGQMGNSEVGHINLGSGRAPLQQLEAIEHSLNTDFLEKLEVKKLLKTLEKSRCLHLIGMISDGGIHSHVNHTLGLIKTLSPLCAAQKKPLYIHIITDGRDTPPKAAQDQIIHFASTIKPFKNAYIASVCGRFYAMDRDNREERTNAAFNLYTKGTGAADAINPTAPDVLTAIQTAYAHNQTDEFIKPTALTPLKEGLLQKEDTLLFTNFRADRARQITHAFIKARYPNIFTMTEYDSKFNNAVNVLYPSAPLKDTLGEVVAKAGKTQLRLAETEKYAHVTFFFNGGREEPFKGEERALIPSPKVRTYDLQPEMSLAAVQTRLTKAILEQKYDLIVCNIANGDMVGHTGNFNAAIKAVEAIDSFLNTLEKTAIKTKANLLITADHGNCEHMLNTDGSPVTSHSKYPVPLFYIGPQQNIALKNGALSDIAPTVLTLMGLPPAAEMTGHNLIEAQ